MEDINSASIFFQESKRQRLTPPSEADGCISRCIQGQTSSLAEQNSRKDTIAGDGVGRLLAADLQSLTLADREQVYEDIHGIPRKESIETDDYVTTKLSQFEEHLNTILSHPHLKSLQAKLDTSAASSYRRELFLLFLRSTNFEIEAAAETIIKHWRIKEEFFGDCKLDEPIRLKDLEQDDISVLQDGGVHMLPYKDKSGRTIMVIVNRLINSHAPKNVCRATMYHGMASLEDPATQEKGVVFVLWSYGSSIALNSEQMWLWRKGGEILSIIPFRVASFHYCGPGRQLHPAIELFFTHAVKQHRLRFKLHLGSALENLYELASFGIQKDFLSVDENDQVQDTKGWVENRLKIETQRSTKQSKKGMQASEQKNSQAEVLQSNDVLLATRKKEFYSNQGNIYYRQLIAEMAPAYNDTRSHRVKKRMCEIVIEKVYATGGRFLYKDVADSMVSWHVLEGETLRLRVSQAFRNIRRCSSDTNTRTN